MPDRLIFGLIPWYSALILCGILSALFFALKEEKRHNLPRDTVLDLCLWMIPIGILGARLYYVAFNWNAFARAPWQMFAIWKGGLAIYGALIAGGVTLLVFAKKRRLPVGTLLDTVAIGLPLAQAIGRWGNFFNGEAYGLEITNPALQFFPLAVRIASADGAHWHMATFFYESLWNCAVFLLLWRMRKKMKHSGDGVAWYVLLYAAGRAWIEGLRLDSLMAAGDSLRISQVLSCAMMLAVLLIFLARALRKMKRIAAALGGILLLALAGSLLLPALPMTLRLLCAALTACGLIGMVFSLRKPAWLIPYLLLCLPIPMMYASLNAGQPNAVVLLMLWQAACAMLTAFTFYKEIS